MKILVTGCAGFIGWKTCELLLRENQEVVGIDNLNDAYDARLKEWRLRQLQDHSKPNFRFHHMDIASRSHVASLWKREASFEAVVNLAARAGVRQSVQDPWAYYEANLIGTLNLLEGCRLEGPKFILASTSGVYGESKGPFREDQPTDCPLSPYAASKKAAETLCHSYHRLYDLDVIVLRYFTVYGPAGRPDMSIFRFIRWLAEDEPVVLYGDGSQQRDFTYVDDIARGTTAALDLSGFEIINLGGSRPVRLQTVIGLLEHLIGRHAKIEYHPPNSLDARSTWADISKARKLLGWGPRTALDEGLQMAVEWYRENRRWAREILLT